MEEECGGSRPSTPQVLGSQVRPTAQLVLLCWPVPQDWGGGGGECSTASETTCPTIPQCYRANAVEVVGVTAFVLCTSFAELNLKV